MTFSLAHFLNSGFLNTAFCSLIHHPHQSLPVKKRNRGFFVFSEILIGFPIDYHWNFNEIPNEFPMISILIESQLDFKWISIGKSNLFPFVFH